MAAPHATPQSGAVHLPSLVTGLLIMFGGTLYPPLMADAAGKADHGMSLALFWAMSAGFVHGVGFEPRHRLWQVLFSGRACAVALLLAAGMRLLH